MPKLYFRYGTMNSSKTTSLLTTAHNYISLKRHVILIKPSIDTRSEYDKITSRCGLTNKVDIILGPLDNISIPSSSIKNIDCILVDEAQFLSPSQVDQLRQITKSIPVIAYGLRTDSQLKFFPGSRRLMEVADSIEEIKMICSECERKSIVNARYRLAENGTKTVIYDAEQLAIGGEDMYYALCFFCWDSKRI